MNWEDTVMNLDDRTALAGKYDFLLKEGEIILFVKAICEAQAKKTWEARDPEIAEAELRGEVPGAATGLQKIVDWVEQYREAKFS